MNKKSRILKRVGVCFLASLTAFSMVGCGDGETILRDEKTINIRMYRGGYGTTYMTKLIEKFEALYEEEGYKVNLLTPSAEVTPAIAVQELYTANDWADMYFCGIGAATNFVKGDYGLLVSDLTDVWNSKPIGFDGIEEEETLKEKCIINIDESVQLIDGKVYAIPSKTSIGGLLVNKEKLDAYGLEIPKTTKEMIDVFEGIYLGTNGEEGALTTDVYPLTFLGGENGYPLHYVNTFLAQYVGKDVYDQMLAFEDAEGNILLDQADGYKIFENKGYEEMFKVLYQMHDAAYVAPGSMTNTLAGAHIKIMSEGGAVFMSDGDWAYNEIITDYPEEIKNLVFANFPVISALGVKLFGADTTYKFDAAKCEEVLRYFIDAADDGETVAAAVAAAKTEKGWDIQEKDAQEVMEARGLYYSRSGKEGGGSGAVVVSKKTSNLEICKLFLRMMASDDNSTLYNQESNGFTSYMNDFSLVKDNSYVQNLKTIFNHQYAQPVQFTPTSARRQTTANSELLPEAGTFVVNGIIQKGLTIYGNGDYDKTATNSIYENAAKEAAGKELTRAQSQWDNWKSAWEEYKASLN